MTSADQRKIQLAANNAARSTSVDATVAFSESTAVVTLTRLGAGASREVTVSASESYDAILRALLREAKRQEVMVAAPKLIKLVPPLKK